MPRPIGAGDTGNIAGLKCRNSTKDVSPQCRGCAGCLISRLNSWKNRRDYIVLLIDVHIYLHLYFKVLSQHKPLPNTYSFVLCSGVQDYRDIIYSCISYAKGSLVKVYVYV